MNNTAVMFRRNVRLVYIVLAAAVFSALQPYFHLITESRTYRELTLQMPFSNVMHAAEATGDHQITIYGTMIKRRCTFVSLAAYVSDGIIRTPASLDTTPEEAVWGGGSRPPSDRAEAWGPWVITDPTPGIASAWEVYATHSCHGQRQTNLFARGSWPQLGD